MEPTKIVDKLTLRQEAMRLALQTVYGVNVSEYLKDLVIKRAADIADYIQGDTQLPEYEDTHKDFKEMLAKMQESLKLPLLPMWISADSEMKPEIDTQVLVMCADSKYPKFGEYLGEGYWEVEDADVIHLTKDGEVTVVAWLSIPKYEPTL